MHTYILTYIQEQCGGGEAVLSRGRSASRSRLLSECRAGGRDRISCRATVMAADTPSDPVCQRNLHVAPPYQLARIWLHPLPLAASSAFPQQQRRRDCANVPSPTQYWGYGGHSGSLAVSAVLSADVGRAAIHGSTAPARRPASSAAAPLSQS